MNDTSSTAATRLSARPRNRANLSTCKRMADVATCEPVFGRPGPPGSEPLDRSGDIRLDEVVDAVSDAETRLTELRDSSAVPDQPEWR